jgi:hypothetical protein
VCILVGGSLRNDYEEEIVVMIGQNPNKVKYFKVLVFCKGCFQGGGLFTHLRTDVLLLMKLLSYVRTSPFMIYHLSSIIDHFPDRTKWGTSIKL